MIRVRWECNYWLPAPRIKIVLIKGQHTRTCRISTPLISQDHSIIYSKTRHPCRSSHLIWIVSSIKGCRKMCSVSKISSSRETLITLRPRGRLRNQAASSSSTSLPHSLRQWPTRQVSLIWHPVPCRLLRHSSRKTRYRIMHPFHSNRVWTISPFLRTLYSLWRTSFHLYYYRQTPLFPIAQPILQTLSHPRGCIKRWIRVRSTRGGRRNSVSKWTIWSTSSYNTRAILRMPLSQAN